MRKTTLEAVLSGHVRVEDAPEGLQALVLLAQRARGPAESNELLDEAGHVSAIAAAIRVARAEPQASARRAHHDARPLWSLRRGIAIAIAILVVGVSVTTETGSLPSSVQREVAAALRHVGVSVPDPLRHAVTIARVENRTPASSSSTTTTVPSASALCRLFEPLGHHATTPATSSTEYAMLSAKAAAKGESVAVFCRGVTKGSIPATTIAGSAS